MAFRVKSKSTLLHQQRQAIEKKLEAEKDLDNLLVFGYSCKLFRDDENALLVNSGETLVPWQGDETLMVDRFDGRGHLWDLKPFDAENAKKSPELTEDELFMENLCEEERYLELHTDVREKAIYEEEDVKRLTAELHEDDTHHAVPFSYEAPRAPAVPQPEEKFEDLETYVVPDDLQLPETITAPTGAKLGAIIERTAGFVARKGMQMEILLKTRQAQNPQFSFLNYDDPLHAFYQHVVLRIRKGVYCPREAAARRPSDEGDGHYLHPSLTGSPAQEPVEEEDPDKPLVLPSLPEDQLHSTSYGKLLKKLAPIVPKPRPTVAEPQPKAEEAAAEQSQAPLPAFVAADSYGPQRHSANGKSAAASSEGGGVKVQTQLKTEKGKPFVVRPTEHGPSIVPPPPDLQGVIDKMADYVAKNGADFEEAVKAKKDPRFEFLLEKNQHHAYYLYKKHLSSMSLKSRPEIYPASARGLKFSIRRQRDKADSLQASAVPGTYSPLRTPAAANSDLPACTGSPAVRDSSGEEGADDTLGGCSTVQSDSELVEEGHSVQGSKQASAAGMDKKLADERVRDRLAAAARHRLSREQLERKRRAENFLQKVADDSDADPSAPSSDVGPLSMGPSVCGSSNAPSIDESDSSPSSSSSEASRSASKRKRKPEELVEDKRRKKSLSPVLRKKKKSSPAREQRRRLRSPSPSHRRKKTPPKAFSSHRSKSPSKKRHKSPKRVRVDKKKKSSRSRSPRSKHKKRSHSSDSEHRHREKKSRKHKKSPSRRHKHKSKKHKRSSPHASTALTNISSPAVDLDVDQALDAALLAADRESLPGATVARQRAENGQRTVGSDAESGELQSADEQSEAQPSESATSTSASIAPSHSSTLATEPGDKAVDQRLVDRVREMLRRSRQLPL